MAKESRKAQKKTYTAPRVRNVVSNRTMAFADRISAGGSGMPLASQAAADRAYDLITRYGVNYNLTQDGRGFRFSATPNQRNQERIRRAMSNIWSRVQ